MPSSRQRSIIRHPHDYNGAQVEGPRIEGSGPNRQSITVEYAYASNNYGIASRSTSTDKPHRASYIPPRNTPPRPGSPVDRPPHRVRNSLYKNPPPGTVRKLSKEPAQILEAPPELALSPGPPQPMPTFGERPEQMMTPPVNSSVPPRPSRANTEMLHDLYTPDVAAYSEQQSNTMYDRRVSLPALPADEDAPFIADMGEALPIVDPQASYAGAGYRSRSATTSQSKPKKGGMLSFMTGTFTFTPHHSSTATTTISIY